MNNLPKQVQDEHKECKTNIKGALTYVFIVCSLLFLMLYTGS